MTLVYILLTFLLLDILVVLHEGGHFLFARLSGIKVNEFSVGMGPAVFSRVSKKSGIRYSFRALPIGGYVAMEGEDGKSEVENAFCNASIWGRLATVFAGPVCNLLVGFIAMTVLTCTSMPASTVIARFDDDAVSSSALCVKDEVIKVGSVSVHTGTELVYEIMNQGAEPIDMTVIRDGEELVLEDVSFPTEESQGVTFGSYDFVVYAEEKTVLNVAKQSFYRCVSTVKMITDSLWGMISGKYGVESISGPIGISSAVGEAVSAGFTSVLYLFAVISVNLGIMNLLPFPALDGGRIILLLYELIFRRKPNPKAEQYINGIGMALLMALMLLITCKDIFNLF